MPSRDAVVGYAMSPSCTVKEVPVITQVALNASAPVNVSDVDVEASRRSFSDRTMDLEELEEACPVASATFRTRQASWRRVDRSREILVHSGGAHDRP